MARAAARVRTESMIDRLGRKPMGEGYELWDKGYTLGALRLFQCKLELAPPFEVAMCLDCVAEILHELNEPEEALEHYTAAKDKYDMIGRPLLSNLMLCKEKEMKDGPQDALDQLSKMLQPYDARRSRGDTGLEFLGGDEKMAVAVGRCYLYRAELLGGMERAEEALIEVDTAIREGSERLHLAHARRGDLLGALERTADAIAAYTEAIDKCDHYVDGHESLTRCLRAENRDKDALDMIEKCMKLHPKATLIRDKSFILSNLQQDEQALELLDKSLEPENLPHEETEGPDGCESAATLFKAKAAILADLRRFEEANRALESALGMVPDDEEAESMRREVYVTLGRDYLAEHNIPQYLDKLVAKVLEEKPEKPLGFMISMVLKDQAPPVTSPPMSPPAI